MSGRDLYKATPQDYFEIFKMNPHGVLILEQLEGLFAKPAVVKGGIDAILQTFQREGMRQVLDHINTQIDMAGKQPQTQEE